MIPWILVYLKQYVPYLIFITLAIMDMRMETTSPTSGKIDASIEGVVRSCSSTAPAPSTCAVPVPQPPPRPQAKIQLVNFDRTKESQMLINHNALITRIREKMPGAERFDMEMLALISEVYSFPNEIKTIY
jgi:hypothetical protein